LSASNDQSHSGSIDPLSDEEVVITAKDIILQPFMKGDEEISPSPEKELEFERHHGKD